MKNISLKKHFVTLSKDSLIYGVGNSMIAILMLFLTPVLTRVFTPSDYGLISYIVSIVAFLNMILLLGMESATHLSYFQYNKERKIVISSGFWFLVGWGLLVTFVAILFAPQISVTLLHNLAYKNFFIIAFIMAYLALLVNFFKTVLRLEFKAKQYAIISVVYAVSVTGFIFYLTAILKIGVIGYFLGTLIGNGISFILALVMVKNGLVLKISTVRLKEMLTYGLLMLPSALFYFVFDLIDRFFINKYWNLNELGLYAVAISVTGLIGFFTIALSQAWTPLIYKIYFESKSTYNLLVSRIFTYYLILFLTLTVMVTVFGSEILRILAPAKYYGALPAIIPLSLVMVFLATTQITALGISITRKLKYVAIYSFLAALLNIGLNFLLIPKYGMVGAAWATAATYLFLTSLYLITSQKLVPVKISWLKIIKLILLSAFGLIIFPHLWLYSFWLNLGIKIGEIFFFLTFLYLLGIIEKQELIALIHQIKFKKSNRKGV